MKVIDETKEIDSIAFEDGSMLVVGTAGVGKITAYSEDGGLGPVLWFNVELENGRLAKYNGLHVFSVAYLGKDEKKGSPIYRLKF